MCVFVNGTAAAGVYTRSLRDALPVVSLQDRIDDALDAKCRDVEVVQELLDEADDQVYELPSFQSLKVNLVALHEEAPKPKKDAKKPSRSRPRMSVAAPVLGGVVADSTPVSALPCHGA